MNSSKKLFFFSVIEFIFLLCVIKIINLVENKFNIFKSYGDYKYKPENHSKKYLRYKMDESLEKMSRNKTNNDELEDFYDTESSKFEDNNQVKMSRNKTSNDEIEDIYYTESNEFEENNQVKMLRSNDELEDIYDKKLRDVENNNQVKMLRRRSIDEIEGRYI